MNNIIPKKELGQNFLIDSNITRKIIDVFDCQDGDIVVEIGPGTGALTEYLVKAPITLFCIELDTRAANLLENRFPKNKYSNIEIINQDVRKFSFKELYSRYRKPINVIGNIPYNISSDIFFMLFENFQYVNKAILMIQKEVALRLVGKPRTKEYGISTVALDLVGKAKRMFDVPSTCFYPRPKVTSSIIEIYFDSQKSTFDEYICTMKIVKKAFNQRRKTLRNALKDYLPKDLLANLEDNVSKYLQKRAEELNYIDFKYIASILLKNE